MAPVKREHKDCDDHKRRAAEAAVAYVESGMLLGLGTGSTSAHALHAIARRLSSGELRDVAGVPTSRATRELALSLGIPMRELAKVTSLDLAIDGADEVDPDCQLIKGGGGALLREKAVEQKARRFVVIVDESKLSPKLGTSFALPVEVEPAKWREVRDALFCLGAQAKLRGGDVDPFRTDNDNFIIDARFGDGIDDPRRLAEALERQDGVRAHGLFIDMASEVVVAGVAGVQILLPNRAALC